MRILGKGKTAQGIKEIYPDAKMYDNTDNEVYDINSDELTIVSPGIPPHNYLVKNTKNKISDYDLFLNDDIFTIWISGTNGKTTTTQMIYHLIKDDSLCGGNIGTALAQIYKTYKQQPQTYNQIILETSSFTLHYTVKTKPNIYVLLPISDDHISWHGSFKEYESAKLKPLKTMGEDDVAIIPLKYKNIKSDANIYYYENSNDLAKQFHIQIDKIKFKEPFLLDSLLALCVEKIVKGEVDYEKINQFKVDEHKVEEFKDKYNRIWIDDSKATNVDATIWALKGFKENKILLILGGDDKGADLNPLFEEFKNYDIKIFSIGTNANRLSKLAKNYNIDCTICNSLKNAVDNISKQYDDVKPIVAMLSPAAASLDQYSSYKHRGEEFKKFVNLL